MGQVSVRPLDQAPNIHSASALRWFRAKMMFAFLRSQVAMCQQVRILHR